VAALREAAPRSDVEVLRGDLALQDEVRRLGEEILERTDEIHVLLNNHGVTLLERTLTPDGFESTFAINHLGYFHLTGLLLPRLLATPNARIVNVASDAHRFGPLDLDDLHSEKRYSAMRVYGRSKSANIHFTRELARRLAGTGVTANCLHPGGVSTNLGSGSGGVAMEAFRRLVMLFMKSPEEGARTSVYLATSDEVAGRSGGYYADCRAKQPAAHCRDDATAKQLWAASEEMTGLRYP
jgi:NAD(P)-dependent dehydrogenase (short-subunit alcohol dehydrogenase family)